MKKKEKQKSMQMQKTSDAWNLWMLNWIECKNGSDFVVDDA